MLRYSCMLRSVVENAGLEYNMCVCALNISAIGYMGYRGYRKSVQQLPALADRTCTFIANKCGSVWSTSATLVVYCSFLPIGIYQYKLQINISTEIYLANLAVLNLVGFRIRVILSAHPVCDSICTSTPRCSCSGRRGRRTQTSTVPSLTRTPQLWRAACD